MWALDSSIRPMLPKKGSRRAQHGYKACQKSALPGILLVVSIISQTWAFSPATTSTLTYFQLEDPSWLSTKSWCSLLGSPHCRDGTSQFQLTTCSSPPPALAKQAKVQAREARLQMFENQAARDGNILILVAGTTSTRADESKAAVAVKLEEIMRAFDHVGSVGEH